MRACLQLVTLAIIAMFTTNLRAPSLPFVELFVDLGHDLDEQVTAHRATTPPVLSTARPGRSFETERKAPFLAILPSCPLLSLLVRPSCELGRLADQLRGLPVLPRTSRGPPSLT